MIFYQKAHLKNYVIPYMAGGILPNTTSILTIDSFFTLTKQKLKILFAAPERSSMCRNEKVNNVNQQISKGKPWKN